MKDVIVESIYSKNSLDAYLTTPDGISTFTNSGIPPQEITTFREAETITIYGITPEEAIEKYAGTEFNFDDLVKKFGEICLDFLTPLELNVKSQACDFAMRVIYEIGPKSRAIKKADGDRAWKLKFPYSINNKLHCRTAFICTYKEDEHEYRETREENKIILTIKQAGLLAMKIMNEINELGINLNNSTFLLSPLAGAIFSKEDIDTITSHLGLSKKVVVNMINSSCQSAGQYLEESDMACAAVAALVATRNLKDTNIARSIVQKILKQYCNAKKEFLQERFLKFAEFANGGLPSHINYETLKQLLEKTQEVTTRAITAKKLAIASKQTAIDVNLSKPGPPPPPGPGPAPGPSAPPAPPSPGPSLPEPRPPRSPKRPRPDPSKPDRPEPMEPTSPISSDLESDDDVMEHHSDQGTVSDPSFISFGPFTGTIPKLVKRSKESKKERRKKKERELARKALETVTGSAVKMDEVHLD